MVAPLFVVVWIVATQAVAQDAVYGVDTVCALLFCVPPTTLTSSFAVVAQC